MGANSAAGESKKRTRKSLVFLKKIVFVIGILDLALTINDARNVGRFFLLLTMSSTFDVTPENVIRDHCHSEYNFRKGICETYSQMMETGTLSFPSEINGRSLRNGNVNAADTEKKDTLMSSYFQVALSIQSFPEMFKDFITSWKSTFDPSRTDGNISFYFDDEKVQGIHDEEHPQTKIYQQHHVVQPSQSQPHISTNSKNKHEWKPSSSLSQNRENSVNLNQRKSERSGGNHESHLNSDAFDQNDVELTHSFSDMHNKNDDSTRVDDDNLSPQNMKRMRRFSTQITNTETKDFAKNNVGDPSKPEIDTDSNPSPKVGTDELNNKEENKSKKGTEVETTRPTFSKSKSASATQPASSSSKSNTDIGSDHFKKLSPSSSESKGGKTGCKKSHKFSLWQKDCEEEKEMVVRPKKIMGFLQEELFTRWHSLLQNAKALISPKNMSVEEQLALPEARVIKMHIELKPFGPRPLAHMERRVNAAQQVMFDSPWLTILQLYPQLSPSFVKMFVVVTLYTWIWGVLLALILLHGSTKENPAMVHAWIIFNILYSLLFFMIDDWIHTNISPVRSTVSIWLSILHSLYKPLATWLVLMFWSEMKKLGSFERHQCLNTTTMKLSPSSFSQGSNSSSHSEPTKESTVVVDIADIVPSDSTNNESNTAAALLLAATTLRLSANNHRDDFHHNDDSGNGENYEDEEEDDDEEDDEDEDEEDFEEGDESEGEDEDEKPRDLEKGENGGGVANIINNKHSNNLIVRGCNNNGYVVNH